MLIVVVQDLLIIDALESERTQIVAFIFVEPLQEVKVPFVSGARAYVLRDWAAGVAQDEEHILAVEFDGGFGAILVHLAVFGDDPVHHFRGSPDHSSKSKLCVELGPVFFRPLRELEGKKQLRVDVVLHRVVHRTDAVVLM